MEFLEPTEEQLEEQVKSLIDDMPEIDVDKEHELGNYIIKVDSLPCFYEYLTPYLNKAKKNKIDYTLEELYRGKIKDTVYAVISFKLNIILNDWKFAATIEHTDKGNIIRNISGMDLPLKYREVGPCTCDHCKTVRWRNNTYVVYNESTKEYKQVGKNCLKVYTGIDAGRFAYLFDIDMEGYNDDSSSGGDYDDLYCRGNNDKYCNIKNVLSMAYTLINRFGYVSSKKEYSTKSKYFLFEKYLNPSTRSKMTVREVARIQLIIELNKLEFGSKESNEYADKALAWLKEQSDSKEFIYNLKVICDDNESTSTKNIGYVLALMSSYLKEVEQREINKKVKSVHVGNVKDKLDFKVLDFTLATSYDTDFGTVFIYRILDMNENIYIWKTSKVITCIVKSIKGTVKAHNDYKGIKQTELTRCKVQELELKEGKTD